MKDDIHLNTLVDQVMSNPKYQHIATDLVQRLSQEAIAKGLYGKPAVKAVRNKLHQIGGAYFKRIPNYTDAEIELSKLPQDLHAESIKQFCVDQMETHASTAERLPILDTFFHTCLAPIAPVESVLDLACGLNPLAIPWMPLANGFRYDACDIYQDMTGFINKFFNHYHINAEAYPCDLLSKFPDITPQVTFLLKSIPCLEQIDRNSGSQILSSIKSKHILISFPVRSLTGRKKGMPDFYRDHFYTLVAGKSWEIREFIFTSELAFLVTK
jgi:16S rRNA (guanine(1405)-N(7))-methyltransferase